MRIVLDTNVLISGIAFRGAPSRIIQAAADGAVTLVAAAEIVIEYYRIAQEFHDRRPTMGILRTLDLLVVETEFVAIRNSYIPCRDPDDEVFAAAALAASCPLISGDKDLLELHGVCGLTVLTPRQFVDQHLHP